MKSVQSRLVKKVLSTVLAISFVVTMSFGFSTTAFASKTSDLRDKKEKIENRINETEQKIQKLSGQQRETEEYISTLDTKIQLLQDKIDVLQEDADALQANIDTVQNKITTTENEIDSLQIQIDKKQKEFDTTFEEYCQRLRALYIAGSATNLEVLLTSTDISAILTRSQMIKSVSKKDSKVLNSLMKKMEEIEKDKASLQKKRIDLEEDKKSLVSEKAELQKNIDSVASTKSELDAKISEANALMRKLSNQKSEYQEAIEEDKELVAEVERDIQAAIAAAQAQSHSGGNYVAGTGQLGYPTSYRGISAGFPNYSSGRYHGGIDFPCPEGTEVHAADSGRVIVSSPLWYSYGHYIIIDHGNGISTLYAHNSQLLVSVGQSVSKGQLIAYSGNTGNSTGAHCHFEVRVNGTQVNPLNYL